MDVYAHILERLDAPLLQRHCNTVITEELKHVHAQIEEMKGRIVDSRKYVCFRRRKGTNRYLPEHGYDRSDSISTTRSTTTHDMDGKYRAGFFFRQDGRDQAREHGIDVDNQTKTCHQHDTDKNDANHQTEVNKLVKTIRENTTKEDSLTRESCSETESDEERQTHWQSRPEVLRMWERQVDEAEQIARRLFVTNVIPTTNQLVGFVELLTQVLARVPTFDGDIRTLTNGKFNDLILLTSAYSVLVSEIRHLLRLQRLSCVRFLCALSDAIRRIPALHERSKYHDDLLDIKVKMEQDEIMTSSIPPEGSLPSATWETTFETAWAVGNHITTQSSRPSVDDVIEFSTQVNQVVMRVQIVPGNPVYPRRQWSFESISQAHDSRV